MKKKLFFFDLKQQNSKISSLSETEFRYLMHERKSNIIRDTDAFGSQ
jgi:hypothetical protein